MFLKFIFLVLLFSICAWNLKSTFVVRELQQTFFRSNKENISHVDESYIRKASNEIKQSAPISRSVLSNRDGMLSNSTSI